MAKVNQSTVKTVNIHQSKINVMKFDGTNNFDVWRCEVMDALNLKDTLLLQEKRAEVLENDWNKMNRTTCRVIRSCLHKTSSIM